ncbi:hypothetical protein AB1K54_06230 [Microbacterium sp. BWT-B31]|uniref:hypothetical protein n=1 Tax=Microbacterium sp. BWT-B31 TaxID=3232072 RepID=UPI0035274F53
MTTAHATPDRRPGRAAAALHISRATARGLLAMPKQVRADLLAEVSRVDPHATLAWLRTQPPAEAI